MMTANCEENGIRLDVFLSESADISRSTAVKWIENGQVTVNGVLCAEKKRLLKDGDAVTYEVPEAVPCAVLPEDVPLDIVYEDEDIIVLNKPKGIVVHPAPGNETGTLVNGLLYHCHDSLSGIGGVLRPGIVHRIDKDTTGLLVVAKNDEAHIGLSAQLQGHHIDRIYTAIVLGNLKEDSGTVNAPIGRHPVDRKKMAVYPIGDDNAREAVTHWEVLNRGTGEGQAFTYVKCRLETGRTHQIRVHLASLHHPIMGDEVYGGMTTNFEKHHTKLLQGQCLHAGELNFIHPRTKKEMHFTAPLPPEMKKLTEILFTSPLQSDTISDWD